jgi:deoxyribose-phosphate aldolase
MRGAEEMQTNNFNFLEKPLNKYIDHTLLKPDATVTDVQKLVEEANRYKFASVCVPPYLALPIKKALKKTEVKVCTVVGFPHGNLPTFLKAQETLYFAEQGVDEIDFVVNYGLLKAGDYERVGNELETIDQICRSNNVVSKCIIETCYLDEDEKTFMYRALSERTSVDYIKTSTGFGPAGAQLVDVMNWNVRRMQEIQRLEDSPFLPQGVVSTNKPLKIKAAGGIKDLDTALKFIACGADRLGMSASVKVMEEYLTRQGQKGDG